MKKHVLFCIIFCVVIFSAVIIGCTQPSPLYGTWNDNQGNKISFMSDNTFTASVYDDLSHETIISSGRYNVLLNALQYHCKRRASEKTVFDHHLIAVLRRRYGISRHSAGRTGGRTEYPRRLLQRSSYHT